MTALKRFIARAYIASARSRLKPAASCTPQSLSAPSFTCCSSWVMKGLGARLSQAINSRQLVAGTRSGALAFLSPFLAAAAQSSTEAPVMALT